MEDGDEDGRDIRCLVWVIFGELKGARARAGDIFRYHVKSILYHKPVSVNEVVSAFREE